MSNFMQLLSSPLTLLTLTVAVYWGAKWLYKKTKTALLHPMLVSMAVIITFLKLTGIEYETYYQANHIINFMLGVSVVALGYLLYEELPHIRGNEASILLAVFAGSLVGVLGVIGLALLFNTGTSVMISIEPKSVTMPIALILSEISGGVPALTSIAVLITGLIGSIVGPWFMKLIGVNDPVAQGLALGSSAHAIGTARAMEMGAIEGAVGGLAIGLMGVATTILMPIIDSLLF